VNDDLVTRLQNAAWVPAGDDCETTDDRLFREAAEEIKRLRAQNNGLKIRIITLLKKLESESQK